MLKRNFFSVLLLAIGIFCSCTSNETEPTNHSKEIPVVFQVSTLNVETQPMSRIADSGASFGDVVNTIGYYIFDSESKLYKQNETSFDPETEVEPDNFGVIRETMTPGNYKVYFYAYGKGKGNASWTVSNMYGSNFALNSNDKEIFFYSKKDLTISETSKNIEIPLTRQSALMIINILDEVSDQVSKIEYKFIDAESYNIYYDRRENNSTVSYIPNISDENKIEQYQYFFSFPPTTIELTINIYGISGDIIETKELSIPLEANHKTIISGKLFESVGEKDLSILLYDLWDEDIIYDF